MFVFFFIHPCWHLPSFSTDETRKCMISCFNSIDVVPFITFGKKFMTGNSFSFRQNQLLLLV